MAGLTDQQYLVQRAREVRDKDPYQSKVIQNFMEITTFVILSIHKPSLGSCEVPCIIWARLVLFDINGLT